MIYRSQYAISLVEDGEEVVRYQPGNRVLFIHPGKISQGGGAFADFLPGKWNLMLNWDSFVQRRFRSKADAEKFLGRYFPEIHNELKEKLEDEK